MSSRFVAPLRTIHSHHTRPLFIHSQHPRPRPILHKLQSFHTASVQRESWRRSPKVKDAEWDRKHRPADQQQQQRGPRRLWPTEVLLAAYEAGGLPVSVVEAEMALEAFEKLTRYSRPGKIAVQRLCDEHGIQPMTLTILAQILLKAGDPALFPVARELLLSASALDDEAATITLVSQAVQTERTRHPDIAGARTHLLRLVEAGNPAAMVLQAELLAAQGRPRQALQLCEAAMLRDSGTYTGAEAVGATMSKGWSTLAKLRKRTGDTDGARVALEQGAREHHDPWAYYYLATAYRAPAHPDHERFLLRAAAAGISDAAHKLGRYYLGLGSRSGGGAAGRLRPGPRAGPFASLRERRLLASEWFALGAEDAQSRGADESQVLLALLLRGRGERDRGREVLLRARASAVYGPQAVPWLVERWYGPRDFLTGAFLARGLESVVVGEGDGVEGG
ncbi:hypothetical protein MMC26_003249 [Xylographa opegraphella]|nr:hypothetical protein [Xylographa opegraphella]